MIGNRGESVRQRMAAEGVDALVLLGLPNIRYLCGFTGTDGLLIVTSAESFFLTDSRYVTQAQSQVCADQLVCYKNKLLKLVEVLTENKLKRVGFDAEAMSVATYNELSVLAGGNIEWYPLSEQLRSLRSIKSKDELYHLRQAASLNRQAFEEILPKIQPGISERQIALELEFALKCRGGEVNAFDFIVASGERGSLPHGVASEKLLRAGELVTIDFGTRVAGYHSDETVTLALGGIDGKLRQIFDIVLKAHDLALAAVRPGLLISELDAVARDYIADKGYAAYFGHGLGHGVGLEIHEYPSVSVKTTEPLQEGMVITIEPGIYVPGTGGVRIEDTIMVTATGYELITAIPKQFTQLVVS
ncbi:MAG TPA: Xaa-Pro peptidase family protein [Malonomonas sp.]